MSINVQSTLTSYENYRSGYNSGKIKEKSSADSFISSEEKQLSKSAQNMLKSLRSSHSDMNFISADYDKNDIKELLAKSDKEFTVIFSNEELEKMASNQKYFDEKMRGINGAMRMSEQINAQFGFERAFDKTTNTVNTMALTKFAVSFDSDGYTSLFAEIEKTSAKQKDLLEKLQVADTKKTTVQADTWEALLEKINNINWKNIKTDNNALGENFDYSV